MCVCVACVRARVCETMVVAAFGRIARCTVRALQHSILYALKEKRHDDMLAQVQWVAANIPDVDLSDTTIWQMMRLTRSVGCLVAWLVGWNDGWLVGWLVGLDGWLLAWLLACLLAPHAYSSSTSEHWSMDRSLRYCRWLATYRRAQSERDAVSS